MKREFLKNFKVGDLPLTDEIIDAIMAENGRDIEATKKPFADHDTIKQQRDDALAALEKVKAEAKTIEDAQREIQEWKAKYEKSEADRAHELDEIDLNGVVKDAITAAGGRTEKAIRALLDMEALRASKNRKADAEAAVDAIKKAAETSYLFGTDPKAPPYAGGSGKTPVLGSDTSKMTYSEMCAYMAANPGAEI